MDWQENLTTDLDRTLDEVRHRIDDPTVGAVLDRDNSIAGLSPLNLLKDRSDRSHRVERMGRAKEFQGCRMAVGMLWTQVGYAKRTDRLTQMSKPSLEQLLPNLGSLLDQ
jgi:hypothetical protein